MQKNYSSGLIETINKLLIYETKQRISLSDLKVKNIYSFYRKL
jgi:hypothetical protein